MDIAQSRAAHPVVAVDVYPGADVAEITARIRTGLGIKKARQIQQGAEYFLKSEAREIEEARAQLAAQRAAQASAAVVAEEA